MENTYSGAWFGLRCEWEEYKGDPCSGGLFGTKLTTFFLTPVETLVFELSLAVWFSTLLVIILLIGLLLVESVLVFFTCRLLCNFSNVISFVSRSIISTNSFLLYSRWLPLNTVFGTPDVSNFFQKDPEKISGESFLRKIKEKIYLNSAQLQSPGCLS